jgi:hypothetical protein
MSNIMAAWIPVVTETVRLGSSCLLGDRNFALSPTVSLGTLLQVETETISKDCD